ncbi:divisome-associated lipoprotein DalA [Anianabacter salinae]|uniref:CAP domain-containing protein n=1 Tax=Anianabacter salinae TaxID=2851023 RepID=UPI00225E451B|nr:CAP domain-containing protein [Anianabacter salinae]MBV0913545.1 CAP domain-containing protein [Anianabacter salinae]
MKRLSLAVTALALLVSACGPTVTEPRLGPDGKPLPQVYRLGFGEQSRVQFRMLDAVNALRASNGLTQVQLSAELNAAAATHSRDMAVQNRPWHFGSDGSSPVDRVRRVGYNGRLEGEAISETFETELETLGAWMNETATREVILDPDANDMGFDYFQEDGGKIWWTLVMGSQRAPQAVSEATPAVTFGQG